MSDTQRVTSARATGSTQLDALANLLTYMRELELDPDELQWIFSVWRRASWETRGGKETKWVARVQEN